MALLSWKVVHDGKTPPPGEVVRPDERMSWPRTTGIGIQHVLAMFGATFVLPPIMGIPGTTAVFFSGIGTLIFLVFVRNRIPSYLGTSAAFIGPAFAVYNGGGDLSEVLFGVLSRRCDLLRDRRAGERRRAARHRGASCRRCSPAPWSC